MFAVPIDLREMLLVLYISRFLDCGDSLILFDTVDSI